MLQLPSNLTTAALALLLGTILGGGAYHVFFVEETSPPTPRRGVVDLNRFLQPRDTTGQHDPDTEIRYRSRRSIPDTVRRVDTTFVPVPTELEELYVSDSTPLQVGSERVTWTAWNPRKQRYEQRRYSVPDDVFSTDLYALARVQNPRRLGLQAPTRWGLGVGGIVRYGRARLRLEGVLDREARPVVEAALLVSF